MRFSTTTRSAKRINIRDYHLTHVKIIRDSKSVPVETRNSEVYKLSIVVLL